MILVLSGMGDGRRITQNLVRKGYRVVVVASTTYGSELAIQDGASLAVDGLPADPQTWLGELNLRSIVDARHPFYRSKEEALIQFCTGRGILYLPVGREETSLTDHELIHAAYSMEEAAQKAASLGKVIFSTIGSHSLEPFIKMQQKHDLRLVVRVLPEHSIIKKCQDMGIRPKDIVALQGPFSKQINRALFKMYRASVVVTKDSGKAGGTNTKIDAALSLKIPVVVVRRKDTPGKHEFSWEKIIQVIKAYLPLEKNNKYGEIV